MYTRLLLSLLFLVSLVDSKSPLKILVYNSKFGHSHSTFLGNIADILVEEGYNVTSLIPEIYPPFADGTSKSTVLRIPVEQSTLEGWLAAQEGDFSFIYRTDDWDKSKMLEQMPVLRDSFAAQCNYTIHYGDVIDRLKRENYDLMIAENFDHCGIGISHLIKARSLITVATTNLFDLQSYEIGQPLFPSHVPASFGGAVDPHSLYSRIDNIVAMLSSMWMWRQMEKKTEDVFKRVYGDEFPDLGEITARSTFTLTNSDAFLDFAKPMLRKVVEIGGIGVRDTKPLTEEWDKVLALRPRTVVVSFGTVARAFLMPMEMRKALAQAFSQFPETTFLWKYEKPEEKDLFAKGVDNLILSDWLPQNDLLGDDRVQGFLTHAGKGSFFEAAARGKSTLIVPIFGDQYRNAATAEHIGFGKVFFKGDLTNAKKIAEGIDIILNDPEHQRLAHEVKEVIEARPFTPRELLVRNVEFAAKMGPQKALSSEGRQLSYIVYYNIDLLIGFVVLFIVAICTAIYLLLSIARIIARVVCIVPAKQKRN